MSVQPVGGTADQRRVDLVLFGIWIAGALLRAVLLPITMHSDLYQIYSRSYEAISQGSWLVWSAQLFAQGFHNLWLLVVLPFLPDSSEIWSPTASLAGIGAQPGDLERFLAYPYVARALILLKLPYVVGDALVGWMLLRAAPPSAGRWVLALWWLNPITLYASTVFGRHDSLWIAAVVGGTLLAERGRRWLGGAATAAAAAARIFPALLLPFFLVAFRRRWGEVWLTVCIVGAIWLSLDVMVIVRTGVSPTLSLLSEYQHVRYLTVLTLTSEGRPALPVFPLLYLLFLLWWIERGPAGARGAAFYWGASAVVLAMVVALAPIHPHYVVWALPFALVAAAQRPVGRVLAVVHAGLFCLWVVQGGAAVTKDLFLPLGRDFVEALPDPRLVLAALVPTRVWVPAVQAAFSALTLWLGWRALVEAAAVVSSPPMQQAGARWERETTAVTAEEASHEQTTR